MEGYRRVAFPGRKIRSRDEQNHCLVARGSYFAIQRLLQLFRKDQTMPKKCYEYGPDKVIATSVDGARRALEKELGIKIANHPKKGSKTKTVTRVKPPFFLADSEGGALQVSEKEFCERVETYGEGIVKRP
jgi:hypothetical protein